MQNKFFLDNILNMIQEIVTTQTAVVLVIGIALIFLVIIIFLFCKIHSLEKRINGDNN